MNRRFVEIKLHPELRNASSDPAPKTAEEESTWPLLDTAYQLVREAAVRAVFVEIRKQAAEQGLDVGTDEEMFERSRQSGVEGAPTSYLELAPDDQLFAQAFHAVFEGLTELAMMDAVEGLNQASDD